MRNLYVVVIVLLLCFGISRPSHALRCGNKIILEGDFILKVLKNCGKPVFTDFMMYNNHLTKMMVYKKDGRDQIIYLRNNFVIEVL
jgi:hypothetical protein